MNNELSITNKINNNGSIDLIIKKLFKDILYIRNSISENNFNSVLPPNKIAIPTSDGLELIRIDEIIRIEADRTYSFIIMKHNKKIMVSKNIGEFQKILDQYNFLRIHNSHLINIEYIIKFNRNNGGIVIMSDGYEVPVSRGNKKELINRIFQVSHHIS